MKAAEHRAGFSGEPISGEAERGGKDGRHAEPPIASRLAERTAALESTAWISDLSKPCQTLSTGNFELSGIELICRCLIARGNARLRRVLRRLPLADVLGGHASASGI
jgi:hypothetical protein